MPEKLLIRGTRLSCVVSFDIAKKIVSDAFDRHISRAELITEILTDYYKAKGVKHGKKSMERNDS